MIRRPISQWMRFGIGTSAVVVLIGLYTILSYSRQATARREQVATARSQLAAFPKQQQSLDNRRTGAASIVDPVQRERTLRKIAEEEQELEKTRATLLKDRDQPDAIDRTVPTWGLLFDQGLIRACSPQGSFKRKEIWITSDFTATALRLVTALVVGVVASMILGILMGCMDAVDAFFMPPFAFMSKVPATAVLPIFFILVHINFKMYVAIIVFGVLPTLAQSISQSVRKDVPDELIFKAYTLGASQLELIWELIYKQTLPRVLDTARLQIGSALVLLVAAEWMVAGTGVGYRLRLFYQRTDMTVVFVYVIILGLLGLAADYSLIWLRRKLCPWFGA